MSILSDGLRQVLLYCLISADLHDVIDTCCEKGTEWAREDSKCDNYPGVGDIDSRYQRLCRTTLEVCCLKSKQEMMCEIGKKDAKVHSMCAIRDDVLAAVTYRVSFLASYVPTIWASSQQKLVFRVSVKARLKPVSLATETS